MVIPAPGFDPALTLAAVSQERCTSLYGVPTMFIAEWALPDFASYDLSSVRTGIMAGSPCPAEMMRKLIDAGITEMTICYGMTETSPVSTQTRTDDAFDVKVGTVGRVGPHLEVKVVDPLTGDTVPRGEAGELATKGYSVMLGYWDEPDKTAEVLRDGWMHTGDLAVMDEAGNLSITGRIKDMVIRGGENIYPREIEEFLYSHPDIEDVQVVGVPDEKYGEELCAWLRMRPGADPLDAAAVREFATGKLAHYKIPRYVLVVDEFPMTVTGKVRKVEMRTETDAPAGAVVSLTIAEAAEQTGLTAHTLRYYERDGLMRTPVRRSASGHRAYDEDDLAWISLISKLRATGMPIRDVKRYADLVRAGAGNEDERLELLRAHRERVLRQLDEVRDHLSAIDHKVELYERLTSSALQGVDSTT